MLLYIVSNFKSSQCSLTSSPKFILAMFIPSVSMLFTYLCGCWGDHLWLSVHTKIGMMSGFSLYALNSLLYASSMIVSRSLSHPFFLGKTGSLCAKFRYEIELSKITFAVSKKFVWHDILKYFALDGLSNSVIPALYSILCKKMWFSSYNPLL